MASDLDLTEVENSTMPGLSTPATSTPIRSGLDNSNLMRQLTRAVQESTIDEALDKITKGVEEVRALKRKRCQGHSDQVTVVNCDCEGCVSLFDKVKDVSTELAKLKEVLTEKDVKNTEMQQTIVDMNEEMTRFVADKNQTKKELDILTKETTAQKATNIELQKQLGEVRTDRDRLHAQLTEFKALSEKYFGDITKGFENMTIEDRNNALPGDGQVMTEEREDSSGGGLGTIPRTPSPTHSVVSVVSNTRSKRHLSSNPGLRRELMNGYQITEENLDGEPNVPTEVTNMQRMVEKNDFGDNVQDADSFTAYQRASYVGNMVVYGKTEYYFHYWKSHSPGCPVCASKIRIPTKKCNLSAHSTQVNHFSQVDEHHEKELVHIKFVGVGF